MGENALPLEPSLVALTELNVGEVNYKRSDRYPHYFGVTPYPGHILETVLDGLYTNGANWYRSMCKVGGDVRVWSRSRALITHVTME